MAVVVTTFSNTANQNWITSTGWVATDPAFRVNTELTNWINAINDSTIIELVKTPNDATSKTSTSLVQWMLRCRDGDTSSDFGLVFGRRYAGASSSTQNTYAYYARTDSTSNNGYGTYTNSPNDPTLSFEDFTVAGNFFIAYEAVGTTPWFVYSWENVTKGTRCYRFLLRLDTTNIAAGSYYPVSGLGKWINCYAYTSSSPTPIYIISPVSNASAPFKGALHNGASLFYAIPASTTGTNSFFRLSGWGQYGSNHYLGQTTSDILASNSDTGLWGDVITLNGIQYTCIRNFWIKTGSV